MEKEGRYGMEEGQIIIVMQDKARHEILRREKQVGRFLKITFVLVSAYCVPGMSYPRICYLRRTYRTEVGPDRLRASKPRAIMI